MKGKTPTKISVLPFLAGILVFALVMILSTGIAFAAPTMQENSPEQPESGQDCGECHLDIAESWMHSPHAHAFDDPYFQQKWEGLAYPGECLSCHTTNYVASTGEYTAEGVYCEACHGKASEGHPPEVVDIRADTEYCGTCHTTTLSEWKTTAHHPAGVGCIDCHNPHSQKNLFENKDDLCINCHQKDMERYLEDLHVQKGIGCVDCHALVIPPDVVPDDGIVPTGHSFDITPATCVACHTDALHAGFSLPGFEDGAKNSSNTGETEPESVFAASVEEPVVSPEQRIEALEATLASQNMATLFQGGIVGLVLGGTTAWIVARNVRRYSTSTEEEKEEEDEEDEKDEG
jgi:predicted CXXCH cytochrome family protein